MEIQCENLIQEREAKEREMEEERNEYTAKIEVLFASKFGYHVRIRAIRYYVGNTAAKLQPQTQIGTAM